MISYPIVGPNLGRVAKLIRSFPGTRLSVVADHPQADQGSSSGDDRSGSAGSASSWRSTRPRPDRYSDRPQGPRAVREALPELRASFRRGCTSTTAISPSRPSTRRDSHDPQATGRRCCAFPVGPGRRRAYRSRGSSAAARRSSASTPTSKGPGSSSGPGTCVLHDAGYDKYPEMQCFTPAAARA